MSDDKHRYEYWEHVEAVCKDCLDDIRSGNLDIGDIQDRFHEEVDGSQWLIYTWRNQVVLNVSNNSDALFDEMGSLQADSYGEAMAKMAFFAMLRDVQDRWEHEYADQVNEDNEDNDDE